ncbi:MAG: LysM peptidoglycan-binding domain-containing protein, partial [Heliobacteriaceae bacterium]|nr:LysM peptidoglycan-binding domain-containing protein [Heliobacteriaceae bacterium]
MAVGYGIYALNKSKDDSTTPVEAVKLTTPIITPEAEEKAAAERTEAERIAEAEEKAAAEKTEAERIAEAEREAAAEKAEEEKAAAQYTTRIVQNGETLTSLAEKYNVSVEKIKELNQDK